MNKLFLFQAFSLQTPFSYIISAKEKDNSVDEDIEIEIDKFENIILVTDTIVTYETIKNYRLEERIHSIYTIFFRVCDNEDIVDKKYISKTYSTNNSFKIELFEKKKCIYRKEACRALNRKLN